MRRLIKSFAFEPETAAVFSDVDLVGVFRTNDLGAPVVAALRFAAQAGTGRLRCSTGTENYVECPVHVVPAVTSWLLFEADVEEPKDAQARQVTSTAFRLHDGEGNHYWYTGGVWAVVDDVDQWNTQVEVSGGLSDWDPDLPLGIVCRLVTTDGRYTPTFRAYKLLYELDLVSELADWIYGALVGGFLNLRPPLDAIIVSAGTATFNLSTELLDNLESRYDFADPDDDTQLGTVLGVWDEDSDPYHRVSLYSSYNHTTNVVTLTGAPSVDTRLRVRITYRPIVVVETSQDYRAVASLPAIVLDNIDLVDHGEGLESEHVLDLTADPPTAVILPAPRRHHLRIELSVEAPSSMDLHRIVEAVSGWFAEHKTVTSPTTGDEVTLTIDNVFTLDSIPNLADVRKAAMMFRLNDLYLHDRDVMSGYGVGTLKLDLQVGPSVVDVDIGG